MTQMTVAATQMACGWDRDENIARAEKLVHAAAERGAGVILLQELFETPYFCKDTEPDLLHLAGLRATYTVQRSRARDAGRHHLPDQRL